MIRKSMTIMFALMFLLTAGTFVGAEMAKEGSDTGKTGFTSTSQVLAQGKEYLQINYDARGVPMVENEASPFYMSRAAPSQLLPFCLDTSNKMCIIRCRDYLRYTLSQFLVLNRR